MQGPPRYTDPMFRTLRYTADDAASRHLAQADPELGVLIDRIGAVEVAVTGGGFEVMAEAIVSQQLSAKAAATIWRKLAEQVGSSAESLAAASHESLRFAGLSNRKAEYVADIARATLAGEIDWVALESLDDEAVIDTLVPLRGVGRWTAEMYLVFALGRPDVLALDDFGLRSSAGRMTGLGGPMSRTDLAQRGERWRPWRSAACLWLWSDQG
ncbi:MAG: DNA-3-methyladenine glycosylase 2 family protein [Coriobacteriia bacterium]|nr:DNA-3-methyladenine glycosylase 2 family protein [Coriobacteriia bacterium]